MLAAHKAAVRDLLACLLGPIAQGALQAHPAPVRASAVRLVGSFGKLLATEHTALLEGAVHFVLVNAARGCPDGTSMAPDGA